MNKHQLKYRYAFSAFLLFFLFSTISYSQQVSIETVELEGLPELSTIGGMCQGNNGFLWIASITGGLFKYDGEKLSPYVQNVNDPNFVISDRFECIYADRKGNLWIGSFENGMYRLNPETGDIDWFQHEKGNPASIRSDSIRAIIESRDGIIWIGTGNGLDSFDPQTGEFSHIDKPTVAGRNLSIEHIRTLYEDNDGTIWIGCGSPFPGDDIAQKPGGLYKLDRNTGEITHFQHMEGDEHSLADNRVRAIFEDSRGTFWIGTAGDGLHIMNREKGTFQRLPYDPKNPEKLSRPPVKNDFNYADDHITFITEDVDGFIWIGTFCNGLNRYNPTTKTVEHFGENEQASHNIVYDNLWAFTKTRDNLLWVCVWSPNNMRPFMYKISVTSNRINHANTGVSVRDIKEDADGNLWLGTRNGLLLRRGETQYQQFLIDKDTANWKNRINKIEFDSLNNIWLSTQYGLSYFDRKNQTFTTNLHDAENSNSISSNTVRCTQLNNDETIWIGTQEGLDLLDIKTGKIIHFKITVWNDEQSFNNYQNRIFSILKDKAGSIWIGTQIGIYRFEPETGNFIELIRKHLFEAQCFFEDSKGRIWAGTDGYSLYFKEPESNNFIRFNDSTNVLNNTLVVYGITEDKDNHIWLSSSAGFIRINPETKSAVVYNESWDFNSELMNDFGFTSTSGELFFGDINGYFHFFPSDFKQSDMNLTKIFLSQLFIDNQQILPGTNDILPQPLSQTQKLTLGYLQNNFTIEYNNIDYLTSESEKNVLYKLENYDRAWRKNRGDNQAFYYNIPPGKYTFTVKASNLYGNWTEKSLEIIIKPPWYKTTLAFFIYAVLFVASVFAFDRFMRKRIVQRERLKTQERELAQAKEIEKAYKELEVSHENLKSTQTQLIQSEKMASLGELTAGIAHEIQNPLNFVNNFSEVNTEMVDEAKEEIGKKNYDEVSIILNDIKDNSEKINHHGKRAEAIVKSMLQHSRTSSGQKEPTDINALCDEYLRLSYHGFRAKDKSFNAEFKLEADESLPKIEVVPQDIGRVLLNLINNAFYVVSEKAKTPQPPKGGIKKSQNEYKPTVVVRTSYLPLSGGPTRPDDPVGRGGVRISVQDNGPGIPDSIKDKIFQPFFTTKPTGQGTGLGLSLSYDIIKAHGGELKVESNTGSGSLFIIQLPTKST